MPNVIATMPVSTFTAVILLAETAFSQTTPVPSSGQQAPSIPNEASPTVISRKIVYAPPTKFFCDFRDEKDETGNIIRKNVPTTLAQVDLSTKLDQVARTTSSRRDENQPQTIEKEVVVYYWVNDYSDTGESPATRCSRVANELNEVKRQNSLDLVAVGEMKGKPALCVANKLGGPCNRLIFTIKPNEDKNKVLDAFREAVKGLAVGEEEVVAMGTGNLGNLLRQFWVVRKTNNLPQGKTITIYRDINQLPNGISARRRGGATR